MSTFLTSAWTDATMNLTTWADKPASSPIGADILGTGGSIVNTTTATFTDGDVSVTSTWDSTVSFITKSDHLDNDYTLSNVQLYRNVKWFTRQINIKKYYGILPASVLCNMLCLAVVSRRAADRTVYFYIANMAVWDILSPCFTFLLGWADLYNWKLGDIGCRGLYFAMFTSHVICVWLVVLLTVDRLVAVFFPFKLQWVNTIPNAARATIAVVIFSALINSYNLWGWQAVLLGPLHVCTPRQPTLMNKYKLAFVGMYSLVPTLLLFAMNTALFIGIRKKLAVMNDSRHAADNNNVGHITIMALTASITFLILTGPYSGFIIASYFWDYQQSTADMITFVIIRCASIVLADVNNFINLVIYTISGKRFREDITRLVGRIFGQFTKPLPHTTRPPKPVANSSV